jgi:hypothetical protein
MTIEAIFFLQFTLSLKDQRCFSDQCGLAERPAEARLTEAERV